MKQYLCEHLYWIEIISKFFSHNFVLMICGGFGWWWKERYFYYKEIERDFLKAKSEWAIDSSDQRFNIGDQYFRLLNLKCKKKHIEFAEAAIYHYYIIIKVKNKNNSDIQRNYICSDLNYYLKLLRNTKKQKDYLWFVDRSLKDLKISKADKNNLIKLGAKF